MDNDVKISGVLADQTIVPEDQQKDIQDHRKEEKENPSGTKTAKSSVQLFLRKELNQLKVKSTQEVYDLESEYAKTRKHKSLFVPLILALCVIVISGLVYLTSIVIQKFAVNVDISSGILEEVNVEDLADEVTRTTVLYENSLTVLKDLHETHESKLIDAKKQYDFDLYVIDSMNIEDKKDLKKRKESAKAEYRKNISDINTEMKAKIDAAVMESKNYKSRLDYYAKQELLNSQENSEIEDNEAVLQRLEREKLIRDYELRILSVKKDLEKLRTESLADKEEAVSTLSKKYQDEIAGLDPEYTDAKGTALIKDASSLKSEGFIFHRYTDKSEKVRDVELRNALREAEKIFSGYQYLYGFYSDLPQKHSVPSYVEAGNRLVESGTNQVVETAVSSVNKLYDSLEEKINENRSLNNALKSVLISSGEKALVLESYEDYLKVFALSDVIVMVKKGSVTASVMHENKEISGSLSLKDNYLVFTPERNHDLSEETGNLENIISGTFIKISEN